MAMNDLAAQHPGTWQPHHGRNRSRSGTAPLSPGWWILPMVVGGIWMWFLILSALLG